MGNPLQITTLQITGSHKIWATKLTRALNQSKLLELIHAIPIDSKEQLFHDDWVTYIDPDLGPCFTGKIISKKRNLGEGEGFVYQLSDVGRTLAKEPERFLCQNACPPYSNPPDPQRYPVDFVFPDGYLLPNARLGTVACLHQGTTLPALPPIRPDLPVLPPGAISTRLTLPPGYILPVALNPIAYQLFYENIYIKDAIAKILECVQNEWNYFVTDYTVDRFLGETLMMNQISKIGMTVLDWLSAILDQTEGGCWEADGRSLKFFDYYQQPQKRILVDNFTGAEAKKSGRPILEKAELTETSDGKYGAVGIYGRGSFIRWTQTDWVEGRLATCDFNPGLGDSNPIGEIARAMGDKGTGTGIVEDPSDPHSDTFFFDFRFYLPHLNPLDVYFAHVDGQPPLPSQRVYWTAHYEWTDLDGHSVQNLYDVTAIIYEDNSNIDYSTGSSPNPRYGQKFIIPGVVQEHGFLPDGIDGRVVRPGPPTISNVKVRYTYYDGPFALVKRSDDLRLAGEGEFVVQRNEFIKYVQNKQVSFNPDSHIIIEDDVCINDSNCLIYLMKAYAAKLLVIDISGKIDLNISTLSGGLIADISPGSEMIDFAPGIRVRAISYDLEKRTCSLDVSTLPIRDFMKAATDRVIDKALAYFNYKGLQINRPDTSLFPLIVLDQRCNANITQGIVLAPPPIPRPPRPF